MRRYVGYWGYNGNRTDLGLDASVANDPKQTSRYCCSTVTCEVMRRVGYYSFDDQGRRFNGVDEASGFAKPNSGVIGITFHKGLPITRSLDGYVLF